ncbi:alpha/beta-hydrolase [Apiospora saccharicola]|uniref:Alpha/beta-hydrolase n=1 Tax=Apiospora saccharicola TaxID=335842 RepID=A0ABR1W8H0_9PEZI
MPEKFRFDSNGSVGKAGREKSHRRRIRTVLAASVTGIVALGYLGGSIPYVNLGSHVKAQLAPTQSPQGWKWADIQPSRDLEWHKCYENKYDCARLDVPLDWQEPTDEERVVLAVIRSKAKTQQNYKGPVFVNPGGPGGSGVSWVLEQGDELQTIVGDNHDILSWDPRGIGVSVPNVECWGSSWKRHDWSLRKTGVADAYPGVVHDAFAQAEGLSRQCEAYTNKTAPNLLRHISTSYHARDMLEISRKAGYDKVRYWGISYGTILGGTFASLFPDHVERLVSDGKSYHDNFEISHSRSCADLTGTIGNVDYGDWFSNAQLNAYEDADKIMEAFFAACHGAGPARCAFHDATPAAIEARYWALLATLRQRPVLLPAHANATESPAVPQLVTYSDLQRLVRTVLYKPLYEFPELARVLAALERRDGLPYYRMAGSDDDNFPLNEVCSQPQPQPPSDGGGGNEGGGGGTPTDFSIDAFGAIACADGAPLTDETPESFQLYVDTLIHDVSRFTGAASAFSKLNCVGRRIRPKWHPHPSRDHHHHNRTVLLTRFPLLFIGNMADNITPLRSSYNNSAVFPGSVVLVQKSYGHASVAAPSVCTARAIRAYFQDGALPAPGTYCDQDYELFEDPPALKVAGQADNDDDGLAWAASELSRKVDLGARRNMAGI